MFKDHHIDLLHTVCDTNYYKTPKCPRDFAGFKIKAEEVIDKHFNPLLKNQHKDHLVVALGLIVYSNRRSENYKFLEDFIDLRQLIENVIYFYTKDDKNRFFEIHGFACLFALFSSMPNLKNYVETWYSKQKKFNQKYVNFALETIPELGVEALNTAKVFSFQLEKQSGQNLMIFAENNQCPQEKNRIQNMRHAL